MNHAIRARYNISLQAHQIQSAMILTDSEEHWVDEVVIHDGEMSSVQSLFDKLIDYAEGTGKAVGIVSHRLNTPRHLWLNYWLYLPDCLTIREHLQAIKDAINAR